MTVDSCEFPRLLNDDGLVEQVVARVIERIPFKGVKKV